MRIKCRASSLCTERGTPAGQTGWGVGTSYTGSLFLDLIEQIENAVNQPFPLGGTASQVARQPDEVDGAREAFELAAKTLAP